MSIFCRMKITVKSMIKKMAYKISPAYRVALRNEKHFELLERNFRYNAFPKGAPFLIDGRTLTGSSLLSLICFAQELHETHKGSFSEFKYCHTGESIVIVATGPTMRYYSQIPNIPHIGVNSAFRNRDIKLDYYFTTDYMDKHPWFEELKNYNFIKFFGQYSIGTYREQFQVPERIILENHGRRFFQGAPSEDIHLDIEYYPLMGFYSITFQAIHFALYTNARRIFLVGCDCSAGGYFDGSKQIVDASRSLPGWLRGYHKVKDFTERFYPETEIISINPVGLRGLFHDVYTEDYLNDNPDIDRTSCDIIDLSNGTFSKNIDISPDEEEQL